MKSRFLRCLPATAALVLSLASAPAAAPVTKTATKEFDLYDEVTGYMKKLVETDRTVGAQWQAQTARARARTGRITNGSWVAYQWLVPSYEFNVRDGKKAEYVYLVKQALREAQVDGYVVEDNVIARVKVSLSEDVKENPAKEGEFTTTKAQLTMEFDGFVGVDFTPLSPSNARPAVTKTFTKDYNVFEEVSSLVTKLMDSDTKIQAQWDSIAARAKEEAGGKFQTGVWIAMQWQVPSFEETDTDRSGDYVYIVRQALREGMRGGYSVSENGLARVRVKVKDKLQPAASKDADPKVLRGELTLTFEGFVKAKIGDGPAAAPAASGARPAAPTAATERPVAPSAPAAPAAPKVDLARFLLSTKGTYGWQVVDEKSTEPLYDFFPDGRLAIQGPDGEATMWEGRWTLKGNSITMTNKQLRTTKTVSVAASGNELLLNGVRFRRYKPE